MSKLSEVEIRILALAQEGFSRADFKKSASALICDFFSCDGLDIYIRKGQLDYTWITHRDSDGGYSFQKAHEKSDVTADYRRIAASASTTGKKPIVNDQKSRLVVPVTIDRMHDGLIVYINAQSETLDPERTEDYLAVAGIFAKAVFFRDSQSALCERIKELTCIYEITRIMQHSQRGIEETLHDVVKIIPSAFQYEESAAARISLDGEEYVSGSHSESPYFLRSGIIIAGSERGFIEVRYLATGEDLEEISFLQEEQNLLDGIAKQLSLLIEEQEAAVEKLKLEDQLRHADRLATIGQLAAGVAHEINEPLANILGFSELIKKDAGLSEQTASDIDKIIRASISARETVKKLLVFAGKIQPGETAVNLNTVVAEGVHFFDYRCKKSNIEVTTRLDPGLPDILADPGQINQVFINLLVNSIQALPDGGKIHIRTGIADKKVFLSVEDNGSGIPEEIRDRIFLPFFTTKRIGEGTGLGLVVVHGVVRAYKGTIEVESSVGDHTIFTIRLPVKDSYEK